MITPQEKHMLRELAKRYAELSQLPIQAENRTRARKINDLIPGRPVVRIDEIPWHEMDINGQLQLTSQDEFAREMEWYFKMMLFRWKYIRADMVVEHYFPLWKHYEMTGIGLAVQEHIRATDEQNHIVSHGYTDQLDTEAKVDALTLPTVTANPENDARLVAMAEEILDGLLPVRLQGHYIYHAPWDNIATFRGVEPVMIDMVERPELIHKTIRKFTEIGFSVMRQMEALGLLDNNLPDIHCTPGYVSDLNRSETNGELKPVPLKNIWFRGMAQMFSDVSPAMHEEFDLQYMMPLFEACGLVYYGCCEALDSKIFLLKKIPNLRKIGVSPWANPERCAEQTGSNYVYSHKPNPAYVSSRTDRETVEHEITRVIETCLANNCPYELVLKDISTVSYRPENLIEWNQIVQETLDRYYT